MSFVAKHPVLGAIRPDNPAARGPLACPCCGGRMHRVNEHFVGGAQTTRIAHFRGAAAEGHTPQCSLASAEREQEKQRLALKKTLAADTNIPIILRLNIETGFSGRLGNGAYADVCATAPFKFAGCNQKNAVVVSITSLETAVAFANLINAAGAEDRAFVEHQRQCLPLHDFIVDTPAKEMRLLKRMNEAMQRNGETAVAFPRILTFDIERHPTERDGRMLSHPTSNGSKIVRFVSKLGRNGTYSSWAMENTVRVLAVPCMNPRQQRADCTFVSLVPPKTADAVQNIESTTPVLYTPRGVDYRARRR